MRGAAWFGVAVFAVVFVRLTSVQGGGLTNCVALTGHPGAVVCNGRVLAAEAATVPAGGQAAGKLTESFREAVTGAAAPRPTTALRDQESREPTWQIPSCRALWPAFVAAGHEFGVDPVLVQIVGLIESGCGQAQSSPVGAQGVMQVMPGTAAGLDPAPDWRTNKAENIRLGARYLAAAMRTYGRPESVDPDYARAIRLTSLAYNGGPGMALRELQGRGIATESAFHARWVTGMWAERHDATSQTLEEWCGLTRWCAERGQ